MIHCVGQLASRHPHIPRLREEDSHMTASASLAEKAAALAQLLDVKDNGWETRVNPTTLDMTMASTCMMGQLYDSFYKVSLPEYLGAPQMKNENDVTGREMRDAWGFEHGLLWNPDAPLEEKKVQSDALLEIWRRLVAERRAVLAPA